MKIILRLIVSLFAYFVLIFALGQGALAFNVPSYDGFVSDYANVLPDDFETNLEEKLQAAAESSSGAELAVVTINSLEDETIEEVAQQFFDEWQIGKKGIDNGVLLLLAIEDRQLRIHTGYGAEAVIPDGLAGRIIRNEITPHLKKGDYQTAVSTGVDQILKYLADPASFETSSASTTSSAASEISTVISSMIVLFGGMFLFIYLAAFLGRSKSWWLGGVIGFFLGLALAGVTVGIILSLFGLLLDFILSKNYQRLKKAGKSTGWKNSWGGFRPSSSYRSSSSRSSSFGGGSSGGGGASGGW